MRTIHDITWIHGSYGHITALAVPCNRYHAQYAFSCDMRLSVSLEEIIQLYHVGNMPHTSSMIPMNIPDPAFVKRKVFLA